MPKTSSRILPLLALAFLFLQALPARAESFGQSYTYTASYHFSAVAWGKPVHAVSVHTGALVEIHHDGADVPERIWQDVQHIQMQRVGDHFEASTVIDATDVDVGGSHYVNLGPVVQYWVTFADGNSRITDVFPIKVLDEEPGSIDRTYAILVGIRRP